MNAFARAVFAILACVLVAAPALAPDWLVSPAPAIPLHVPVTPPPAVAAPSPAPIVTPSST